MKLKQILILLLAGTFLVACGGATTKDELTSDTDQMESSSQDGETIQDADSVISEITEGVNDLKETTETTKMEVDELLKDI